MKKLVALLLVGWMACGFAPTALATESPGFAKEFKKLTGLEPSPISAEAIETAIKELPRDPETIALYKHIADHRPLPTR